MQKEIIRKKTNFCDFEKIYAIDTNIILSDCSNLVKISQGNKNLIVIPDIVMDEIDSNKSGYEEINYESREFSRLLSQSKTVSCYRGSVISTLYQDDKEYKFSSTRRVAGDFTIEIVSLLNYESSKFTNPKNLNDQMIVDTVRIFFDYIKSLGQKKKSESLKLDKNYIFLSIDNACENRAVMNMLNTENLTYKKQEVEKEYFRSIEVENIQSINNRKVINYDPKYGPGQYCYTCTDKKTGVSGNFIVRDGIFKVIDKNLFQGLAIKPKNIKQEFALALMLDEFYNVVMVEAKAGSGKTLLAIAAAMRSVKMKKQNKIIYIRNSIESLDKGEDVGYLPGASEKFKIYNHPLYDTLELLISLDKNGDKINKPAPATKGRKGEAEIESNSMKSDPIKDIMKLYNIETMWVGEMRGRTISDSFVIIDEAQNLSKKTMQTVISRIDKSSKLCIIGSNAQIDNIYTNKYTNGLSVLEAQSMLPQKLIKIGAITLDKVERGPITEWAEEIFK